MNDEKKALMKPQGQHVVLTKASSKKINHWLKQIEAKKVKLSRKEFLNWFIEKSPENLSNSDLNAIVEKYYNEEAFLRQLLREVKQAKKDGKNHDGLAVALRQKSLRKKTKCLEQKSNEENKYKNLDST